MEKFIAYIENFDSDFINRIKGASKEEIEKLQNLVGFDLPAEYQSFLKYFGHEPDVVRHLFYDSKIDIETMTWYYEIDDGSVIIPENGLVISFSGQPPFESEFVMKLDKQPHPIETYSNDEFEFYFADSLENMLLCGTFEKYVIHRKKYNFSYHINLTDESIPVAEKVDKILVKNDYRKESFSSDYYEMCYQKGDVFIRLSTIVNEPCSLTIGMDYENQDVLFEIKKLLSSFRLSERNIVRDS